MDFLASSTGPDSIYTNNMINGCLMAQLSDAKQTIDYKKNGVTSIDEMSELLKTIENDHAKFIKQYEKDDKKYKALQNYGYVLKDIKNLLGIMSPDEEDLSLEDLIENLERLMRSRDFVTGQLNFSFYQDLYTNAMNEILAIEKNYQSGGLTSADALKNVNTIYDKITSNTAEIPSILQSTRRQIEGLLENYRDTFTMIDEEEKSTADVGIERAGLRLNSAIMFNQLNINTHNLINDLYTLRKGLSLFSPNVNLDELKNKMKNSQELIGRENWNADELNDQLTDIKSVTRQLTDDQVKKNWERESFKIRIKKMTEDSRKFALEAKIDTAHNIVRESNERIDYTEDCVAQVETMTDGNVAMPDNVAQQVTETLQEQINSDRINISEVLSNPEIQNDPDVVSVIKLCATADLQGEEIEKLEELKLAIVEKTQTEVLELVLENPNATEDHQ